MEVYTLELKDFSNVTELGMEHQILCESILPQDIVRNIYESLYEKGYIKKERWEFFKWINEMGVPIFQEAYWPSQFVQVLSTIPLETVHDFFLIMKLIGYFQSKTKTCFNFAEYLIQKVEHFQFESSTQPIKSFLESCKILSTKYPENTIKDWKRIEAYQLQFELLTTALFTNSHRSGSLWKIQ